MCNAITVYLITVWVRNNRVETFQNPRLPFFRKKNSLEHDPMLSEGFQNPKIGFQNPRLQFFPQKNSLEHAQILSEDCQIPFLPQIHSNNHVYLITVCNATTVCPKPCGHPIFDIEYCRIRSCSKSAWSSSWSLNQKRWFSLQTHLFWCDEKRSERLGAYFPRGVIGVQ